MTQFIDRRLNGKNKSAVNRQRFLKRFRRQIKRAVNKAIESRSITDIEASESITIPAKDTREYSFRHGAGGIQRYVLPGNKDFVVGDKLPKPQGQGADGDESQASNQGEGTDNFIFEISSDEFLDIFFEDLALPDMVKKQIAKVPNFEMIRAGYTSTGVPTNINIVRSLKGALARRTALCSPYKKQISQLEQQLASTDDEQQKAHIAEHIKHLKQKIAKVPFIDTFDLKFNNKVKQYTPSTQAVMFCIMDVSGSMDKIKKDIAKRFFILLYLFLKKNYQKIELVFIRHHTTAKVVDEHEFFYSRETGGTVVSSALNLLATTIEEQYSPNAWNIYVAQASDGDNWNADSPLCKTIIENNILPAVQYYSYVEIMPRLHQSLWEAYAPIDKQHQQFAMKTIKNHEDIYPVFRHLFKRTLHES